MIEASAPAADPNAWLLAATTPSRIEPMKPTGPEPIPEPSLRVRRAWQVARVVAAVGLALFFWQFVKYRFQDAWFHFALQGDQHQSIGHFWRYSVHGALPPGHLLSDYAFAYHAPPFWWAIMAFFSSLSDPLISAKVLGVAAYFTYALMVVILVGRRSEWLLGLLVGILVLRNPPDMPEQITGGMARSFSPFLLYLFLWAFSEKRHKFVLVLLVLQAGIYPSIVIPCAITYGTYCVLAGPTMRDRLRRCAGMFVAGLMIIGIGKYQDVVAPKEWGSSVTYEEAKKMPAWGPGGRFPDVPHRDLETLMHHNIVRIYKPLGWHPAPDDVVRKFDRNQHMWLVKVPLGFALALAVVGFARRKLRPRTPAARPFPWWLLWIFLGSLAAWKVVEIFAFKLFLPSRQIGFTVQYIVVIALPLLVWYGMTSLFPRQRMVAVLVATITTIAPAFVFHGTGLDRHGAGYRHHKADEKIYKFVRTLPFDEEIAGDVYYGEFIMPMMQHPPYAARNLSHPLRKGYYVEAERRLIEMHRVLYATSLEEIAKFVRQEHVKYFVYNKQKVKEERGKTYKPADDKINAIIHATKGKQRLLLNPPKKAILFQDGDRLVLDLSKFDELGPAPAPASEKSGPVFGPEPEPIIGPQPEPTKVSAEGAAEQDAAAPEPRKTRFDLRKEGPRRIAPPKGIPARPQ